MASYQAVYRATFARQDREAAQARAYQKKHGLVQRGIELRIEYLRRLYAHYLPYLDHDDPRMRSTKARELTKILREVSKYRRRTP